MPNPELTPASTPESQTAAPTQDLISQIPEMQTEPVDPIPTVTEHSLASQDTVPYDLDDISDTDSGFDPGDIEALIAELEARATNEFARSVFGHLGLLFDHA